MFWRGYAAALLVVGVLDALWLGWIARDFYRREFGDLMAEQIRWLPAALFYVGYPAGLVALALLPTQSPDPGLGLAVARGALVGLVAYGVYDLTNLATLRHWSVPLAAADIAWGTLVGAAAAGAAWWAMART
jgi:uncharacterized membrane protein